MLWMHVGQVGKSIKAFCRHDVSHIVFAGQIKPGSRVALVGPDGQVVGVLDVADVFEWDKPAYLKSVYGTERTDHPGADMVLVNRMRLSVQPVEKDEFELVRRMGRGEA